MKKAVKLDAAEKRIEAESSKYVPVSEKKRKLVDGVLERARKTKNINIRISESDLERLKRRAEEEGVPYQTLVSSVLHKYVSDRLVDEKEILKSLELLRTR